MQSTFQNVAQSQTDTALVAAVAGKRIRVAGFVLSGGASATSVTFNSKPVGAGSAISEAFTAPANSDFSPPIANLDTLGPVGTTLGGWFTTNLGEGLSVTTGAGATVGIQVL